MTIQLPRRRGAAAVVLVASLVALACGEADGTPHAAGADGPLRGRTPAGGRYAFNVTAKTSGRLCERLQIRQDNDTSGSSNCQGPSGRSIRGLWDLDCTSKDFVVYGTAYRRVAAVILRTRDDAVVRARLQRHGRRQAFLLVASGHRLPGRVEALSSSGTVLRRMTFQRASDLCRSDAGVDHPLEVTYTF